MATKKNVKTGKRYTPQEKETILAFVLEVNSKNKRGGQKAAAEKFNISPLTISNWLKATKKKATKKAAPKKAAPKKAAPKKAAPKKAAPKEAAPKEAAPKKVAKKKAAKSGRKPGRPAKKKAAKKKTAKRGRPAGDGFSGKLRKLANLNDEIAKAEAGLSKLKTEFAKLKASL